VYKYIKILSLFTHPNEIPNFIHSLSQLSYVKSLGCWSLLSIMDHPKQMVSPSQC